MTIHALVPGAEIAFVPRECKHDPEDEQTRFLCKVLSASERRKLEDDSAALVSLDAEHPRMQSKSGTVEFTTLRIGLIGWENFNKLNPDGSTEPVEFTFEKERGKQFASHESIGMIPPDVARQIANFIGDGCRLSADDEKN